MADSVNHLPIVELGAKIGFTAHMGGLETTTRLLCALGVRPGLHLLEVGCGTGRTARHLVTRFDCDVTAVDAHPEMLGAARDHAEREGIADRIRFVDADARDLPFDDDQFDRVYSESVLNFTADKASILAEMVRTARPGGTVGVNEGTLLTDGLPDEILAYLRSNLGGVDFLTEDGWLAVLADAGLRRVSSLLYTIAPLTELRSLLTWYGGKEFMKAQKNLFDIYRHDDDLRALARGRVIVPRGLRRHVGSGVYVGDVAS